MERDEQVKHLRPTTDYGERFRLTLTTHKSFLEQRWRRQMSFRRIGRKGWSPACPALERTVPCDMLFCHTGTQVEFHAPSTDLMQRKYGCDAFGSSCTPLDYGFGPCV